MFLKHPDLEKWGNSAKPVGPVVPFGCLTSANAATLTSAERPRSHPLKRQGKTAKAWASSCWSCNGGRGWTNGENNIAQKDVYTQTCSHLLHI